MINVCNLLSLMIFFSFTGFAGRIIAIVISVVSSSAVVVVALMIVLYIRNHRYIQQKRKGRIKFWNDKYTAC